MKSNLYTRTGDNGTTALVGGSRIPKDSPRIEAYGTTDELSAVLGAIAVSPDCNAEVRGQIHNIQHRIFNIGSYLATPPDPENQQPPRGLSADDITRLEGWIDAIDEQTPPLRAFILPGGTPLAAQAHVARTICRRAERRIVALAAQQHVDPAVARYINRLSDYLFALARYFNFLAGEKELEWNPGV